MKDKKSDFGSWADVINRMGEEENKKINILSPNKNETASLLDYAHSISNQAEKISWTSVLAHDKIIDYDVAQRIITLKKEELIKNTKQMLLMLGEDE